MLKELSIKNFAIIDNLRIEFDRGFNVLTGETGAGKSIIVDAIGLALGERAQSNLIKDGKKEAVVETYFEVTDNPLLERLGIDSEEGVIVRRIITTSGKNRAYVNSSMVNIQSLFEMGETLVDIHSQHEHQSMLSREKQMQLLDSFGKIEGNIREYRDMLKKYNSLLEEKERLTENIKQRDQRIDFLQFQINEIESAHLEHDEKESLLKEQRILSNLTTIKELSEDAYSLIHAVEGSIRDQTAKAISLLSHLARLDERASEIVNVANQAHSLINELSLLLREYKEQIEFSPERLDEVVNRVELIKRLERKYGEGIDTIMRYKEDSEKELTLLLQAGEKLDSFEEDIMSLEKVLAERASYISDKRKTTALKLEDDVNNLLKELSFEKARFKVELKQGRNENGSYRFLANGIDAVKFLFSANPGEQLKLLQHVASGGELSRIMLALKTAFANDDDIPILVFDEVDAGIGGKTAEVVAQKLNKLSNNHQVLCITHLPQIASKADNHLRVFKKVSEEKVKIVVEKLTDSEREREIAKMLSGNVTDISLKHAREMLNKK